MTDLVACLSSGDKGSAHVARLIHEQEWGRVFLITGDSGMNGFKVKREVEFIVVDFQKPVSGLIEDITKKIRGKISGFEVALNLVCGSGKEHMAILSTLLKLGVGIRLMAVTKDGVVEL